MTANRAPPIPRALKTLQGLTANVPDGFLTFPKITS